MLPSLLLKKYSVTSVSGQEFWKIFSSRFQDCFPPELYFNERRLAGTDQADKSASLDTKIFVSAPFLYWKVTDGETIVGIFHGYQKHHVTFHMQTSVVHPDFRRTGIYTEFIKVLIEATKLQGYLTVTSSHAMSNNSVIVAKLRMGFFITGIEQTIGFGPGVCLAYFQNEEMKKAYAFRCGEPILSQKMLEASSGFEHILKEVSGNSDMEK